MRLWPERPAVDDPKARRWLDWVQTLTYTAWVLLIFVAAVVALIYGIRAHDLSVVEQLLKRGS